jgi:hypothetical protein
MLCLGKPEAVVHHIMISVSIDSPVQAICPIANSAWLQVINFCLLQATL